MVGLASVEQFVPFEFQRDATRPRFNGIATGVPPLDGLPLESVVSGGGMLEAQIARQGGTQVIVVPIVW